MLGGIHAHRFIGASVILQISLPVPVKMGFIQHDGRISGPLYDAGIDLSAGKFMNCGLSEIDR